MPGYELIDNKEYLECRDVLKKSKTFFRMGFDKQRKGIFKVSLFEKKFAKHFRSKYALGVTSGTAALRVAISSLNLKSGDEIITQAFTFVATVEAIVESKCKPVCANIDSSLNLDPVDLEKKITKKTRAVIVVHMLGVPAEMDKIIKICKKRNIKIIEDTAWGCGGKYNNKYLGTIGDIGTFSFDHAKAITTGEGGMIIFKDKKLFLKAKAWHDHGHENNPKLPRWEDSRKSSGFNFRMNELQGAIGLAQLRKLNFIIRSQRKTYDLIWSAIKNIKGVEKRFYTKKCYIAADALIIFVKNSKLAIKCRKALLEKNISTKILPEAYTWHFAGKWSHIKELQSSNLSSSLKKSEEKLKRAVSIPIFLKISKKQVLDIKQGLQKALN